MTSKLAVPAIVLIVALAGCSSGTGTAASRSATPPVSIAISAANAGPPSTAGAQTPAQVEAAVCAAFKVFYGDMVANTPHSATLNAEAEALHRDATAAGAAEPAKNSGLLHDADELVDYFGSSSWAREGSVMTPQVARMQADCP